MTDLFTEKDFVDDGGYHRRADWIRDTVNARMKALMFERDEAYALLKLIAMHPLTFRLRHYPPVAGHHVGGGIRRGPKLPGEITVGVFEDGVVRFR